MVGWMVERGVGERGFDSVFYLFFFLLLPLLTLLTLLFFFSLFM